MSQAGKLITGFVPPPPGTFVETLTGNTGGAVGPDGSNNINVVGDGSTIAIAGNPGTNTLTVSTTGSIPDTFNADSGSAIPLSGIIVMAGGNNIHTTAAGHTVTYNVSGTTNHSLLLGNATGSINNLGVATNGQLPIGSTGTDPVLATLTAGSGITITNGAGSITIAASGTMNFTYTNVNTTPYVVLTTDEFISVDCSAAAITIELPNTPTTGRVFYIKDRTGSAATHNITVTTVGGAVTIDGSTTFVMNTNYESVNVIFNGTNYEVF